MIGLRYFLIFIKKKENIDYNRLLGISDYNRHTYYAQTKFSVYMKIYSLKGRILSVHGNCYWHSTHNAFYWSVKMGLKSVNGIQFSLCGTPTNLIFAHRVLLFKFQVICKFSFGNRRRIMSCNLKSCLWLRFSFSKYDCRVRKRCTRSKKEVSAFAAAQQADYYRRLVLPFFPLDIHKYLRKTLWNVVIYLAKWGIFRR